MTEPTRYPLAWPAGRPRKAPHQRKPGNFKLHGGRITVPGAIDRLEAQLVLLGARLPLLSTDVPIGMKGAPLSGAKAQDPGACVYFQLKGAPYAMACDAYESTAQNIAALAAHVEATRAIERHGVATASETLQAFSALPPPAGARPARPWREVFGVAQGTMLDRDEFDFYFKRAMKKAHPDTGGTAAAAAEVTQARDAGLIEMGWKPRP